MFLIYLPIIEKCFIWIVGLLIILQNFTGVQAQQSPEKILFFGDSITAGYGLNPDKNRFIRVKLYCCECWT